MLDSTHSHIKQQQTEKVKALILHVATSDSSKQKWNPRQNSGESIQTLQSDPVVQRREETDHHFIRWGFGLITKHEHSLLYKIDLWDPKIFPYWPIQAISNWTTCNPQPTYERTSERRDDLLTTKKTSRTIFCTVQVSISNRTYHCTDRLIY